MTSIQEVPLNAPRWNSGPNRGDGGDEPLRPSAVQPVQE
jgi:hypothetical protein